MALLARGSSERQSPRVHKTGAGGRAFAARPQGRGSQPMNLDATGGRSPLVLLVDPFVTSRHFMWRALNRAFGVIEAGSAGAARAWIASRPDIDAIVVQDELPDERGLELVRDLAHARHPVARRSIVLARPNPGLGGDRASGPDPDRARRPASDLGQAGQLVSRARRQRGQGPDARGRPTQLRIAPIARAPEAAWAR